MRSQTYSVILLLVVCPMLAGAAFIEPALEAQLLKAQPKERFSVIVALYCPRDIQSLDQELHAQRANRFERYSTVHNALKANAAETQHAVISQIETYELAGAIENYKAYWIGNLIVVRGTAAAVLDIARNPAVNSVGPNSKIGLMDPVQRGPIRPLRPHHLDDELTTPGQNAIHATQVNRELGITGQGVLVANCDTGVDGAHPAFASRWRGTHEPAAECWLAFQGGPFPSDGVGHGTHVMGTMCGREIDGTDTITVGSAPNAEWIASNAIVGGNLIQDVLDTYEWFADPDGNPETIDDVPDVVQNSWRTFDDCFDDWNTVVLDLEALGCVVTWSAGNEGPSAQTMGTPPEFQLNPTQIFSVGAVDATNDPTPPYSIADFSSRGPSGCPPDANAIKPEVVAPGVNVYSSIPNGGYAQDEWSGTSMAGPHVAGCVALMREACPDCDPQTIKEAILNTCIDYGATGDDNTFGMGFIDAYAAVQLVFSLARVDGYATTSAGSPIEGVRVQALDASRAVFSSAQGYYVLGVQEGTHTLRYTKFGYETVTIENVQATEGDTVHQDVEMDVVPSGVLAGRVVTQVGIPIQNAVVVIQNTPIDTMVSDANGRFYVTLPATTYGVHLQMTVNTDPPTIYSADPTVTVLESDTTFADLEIFIDLIEPAGPDAYGYKAYDRYDRDLPAPAEWMELDPELGNPGIPFDFVQHDSALFFEAPFPIKFYGATHNTLTVNPNGWMLFGEDHHAGNINTAIPSNTNDPAGIIAPVWDDFRMGLGARQFSYYDHENGRWIFEFIDQRLVTPANRFHNWQVHFYDPARHPTLTGDAEIVVVYHLMQYLLGATSGIESPLENTGIQIRYNQTVDESAWPVENGAAIRYTTGHAAATGTVNGTLTLYPTSTDITNAVIWIGGELNHPAANGSYGETSAPAAPISMLLEFEDYEARRLQDVVVPAGGTVIQNMAAWRLDPATNLSASQLNGVVTLRWNRPLSLQAMPNPAATYLVYVNGSLAETSADTVFESTFSNHQVVHFIIMTQYEFGRSEPSNVLNVEVDLAAGEIPAGLPTDFALHQNYPNPFNPSTQIRMDVPMTADASLKIYDIAGRLVRTLHSGLLNAGRYTFAWDGRNDRDEAVATGVYLYRLRTAKFVATEKMMLIK